MLAAYSVLGTDRLSDSGSTRTVPFHSIGHLGMLSIDPAFPLL